MLLNNQQTMEEIKKEIKICIEMHKNENTTTQNLSVQFSSVSQLCPTLYETMDCNTLGLRIHCQLPEYTQTHVH